MFTIVMFVIGSLTLITVDQLTKLWAVTQLHNAERVIPIIEGVFELHYTENRGVAFGMLEGQLWLFIPMTLIIVALFGIMLWRSPLRHYKSFVVPSVMIVAGAVGNLIDRILYGYVIDFLYFKLIDFPVFNFADCCVVIGAVMLFIFFLFVWKDDDMPLVTMLFGIQKGEKENDDG